MSVRAECDPVVAAALERIAPPVTIDADQLLALARAARETSVVPGWSRTRAVLLVATALLVLAGAAYAARELGLLPWLRTSDPYGAAFTVDVSRRYHGPAPNAVLCAPLDKPEFTCRETFSHTVKNPYTTLGRIRAPFKITRERLASLLRQLARVRFIQRSELSQLLRDAREVPSDFFAKVATLQSINAYQFGPIKIDSVTVVPPKDLPFWIVCPAHDGRALRCRPLATAQEVPVGSPIFTLFPSLDWPRAHGKPRALTVPPGLIEHIWGRRLKPSERRLLNALHIGSGIAH
jgi:hypothetical protein